MQVLKSAGYATGIFGKWHLGDEDAYQPQHRGFDEVFIHGAGGIGQTYPGSCGDAPGNTYFNPAILHNGKFEKTQGFCTDVFFAQALRWIDEKRQPCPFFAYITPNAPHAPYVCPEQYSKPYLAAGLKPDAAAYYGMITNIDDNMGRLMAALDDWKLDRQTLLIFMTDNGHPMHGLYNAGMHGDKGYSLRRRDTRPLFLPLDRRAARRGRHQATGLGHRFVPDIRSPGRRRNSTKRGRETPDPLFRFRPSPT